MSTHLMSSRFSALLLIVALVFCFMLPIPQALGLNSSLIWEETTFTEDDDNDGSIGNYIEVTLVQEQPDVEFVQASDMVHQKLVRVDNLPDGLTCLIQPMNIITCRIYLIGNASSHSAHDSIDDLKIEFLDEAFTTGDASIIDDNGRNNLSVDFTGTDHDQAGSLKWDVTVFSESTANDGSISNVITVKLERGSNTSLSFEGSSNMVVDEYAEVTYVPPGLTCIIDPVDSTTCTITMKGQALNHEYSDSIDYLGIDFLDGAFTNGDASQVDNSSMNGLEIVFRDKGEETAAPPITTATFALGISAYTVNGVSSQMDAVPFAQNDRTYVPVRYLAYCLGMSDNNVAWDATARTATLTEGDTVVILQTGNPIMIVNGKTQFMDVVPIAEDDRIFLPARFVAEAFKGSVSWDPATGTVTIVR